jgi:hypothetical protein
LFFLSSPSYLQQSKLSHKNVVYLPLIYANQNLAITMLYISHLPVTINT